MSTKRVKGNRRRAEMSTHFLLPFLVWKVQRGRSALCIKEPEGAKGVGIDAVVDFPEAQLFEPEVD